MLIGQSLWGSLAASPQNAYNILATSAATFTSKVIAGAGRGQAIMQMLIADGGSWTVGTGTIWVQARAIGSGDFGITTYPVAKLNYLDLTTGSGAAGTTSITAVGGYLFDITGLEVSILYTAGNGTGTVQITASVTEY